MSWTVKVDWEKDNNFTGDHDDITGDIWNKTTLDWNIGCQPFQSVADESSLTFEVNNRRRKYSQENTSSPIADYLLPNRAIQVLYMGNPVYTGLTRVIQPAPLRYGRGTAKFECVSIKELLQNTPAYPNLYENVRVDDVLRAYVPALAVPPATSGLWLMGITGFSEIGVSTVVGTADLIATLDVGKTVFRYIGDNVQQAGQDNTLDSASIVNAYHFLSDLVAAERGLLFFGRDGKLTFFNRHRFLNDTVVDYTIDNTMADMIYSTPVEQLNNYIEVIYYPRAISATNEELLWEATASITVPPGSLKSITAQYRDTSGNPVGARDVQTTPDMIYSGGSLVANVEAQAQRAIITLINSGSTDAVITSLQIKGQTISIPYPTTVIAQDAASIAQVNKRPLTISLKALDSETQALNIAYFELSRRTSAQGRVTSVKLPPVLANGDTIPNLTYTVGDLIRIKDYQTGHDSLYHICGESHSLDIGSKMLTTEWFVNPAALTKYWVMGVEDFSNIGVSTRVAF